MTIRRTFLIAAGALVTAPALPAFAGGHGCLGMFTGASNHVMSGRAEIAKEGGKNVVHFLDDFFFDDALDLKVALGKDGYDRSTLMGNLKKNSGKSSYEIPASIDPSQYNEVWIWCEKFNVPLSVAKIN